MKKATGIICLFSVLLFFLAVPARSAVSHKAKPTRSLTKTSKKHRVSGRVKKVKSHRTAARTARKSAPVVEQAASQEEADNEYVEYRVRRGDTLEALAQKFNIDREELIDLNSAAKRRLKPGMTVFIPRTEEGAEESVVLHDRLQKPWKNEEERGILVKVAKSFAGAPYRFGGESVRGLDCSAFVKKMYEIFEVQLPRSAREQFCAGPRVDRDDLTTGDLVFFKTKRLARFPTHVGIYIGDQRFIHASSLFGRGVKVDRLTDAYFTRTYMGAVRIKAPPSDGSESLQPRG